MMKKTCAFLIASAALMAAPAFAQTPEDTAKAVACAQSLSLVKAETDTIVIGQRGTDSVLLAQFDPTGDKKAEKDVEARAFDINTCQLVDIDFWVQDPQGAANDKTKGTSARFSSNLFGSGPRDVRAARAVDRDLGFVVGFVE